MQKKPENNMRTLLAIFLLTSLAFGGEAGSFQKTVGGVRYHACACQPGEIGVYWTDSNGVPYRTFSAIESNLTDNGYTLHFLMNGGIFEEGGVPSGLLVQDGVVKHELNLRNGKGNFYLKPNGVFYIDAAGAHITESEEYAAKSARPTFAVQSGPLLLNAGNIHPDFNPASSNRLHRNGVGVLPDGRVLLAVTAQNQERLPSLYEFAIFFREAGCRQALFLDGNLSQFVAYPRTNALVNNQYGSIIAVRTK